MAPVTLNYINNKYSNELSPDGWAFSIWAVIYFLLAIFSIYQCLPGGWVKSRNDDFIFNKIGWLWSINLILNAIWLIVFMTDSKVGFVFALLIIIGIMVTAQIMNAKSVRNKLSATEMIGFRFGMSIYTGWLTAACIVSFCTMLSAFGFTAAKGYNTPAFSVATLWIAMVVFGVITFLNRDPLYSAVYIWAILAIKSRQFKIGHNAQVESNCLIIACVMGAYLALVTVWCVIVKVKAQVATEDELKTKSFMEKLMLNTHGLIY